MRKNIRWLVLGAAFTGLGLGMPSCPGDKELKSQLEAIQASQMDLTKKIQTLNTQIESLNADMAQAKQLLPQVTSVIQAQKTVLDQMDASIKEIQAQLPKGKKRPHPQKSP